MPACNIANLIGERFGRLVVVEAVYNTEKKRRFWKCICDCGNYVTASTGNLRSGDTRSCGCLHREATSKRNRVYTDLTGRRFGKLVVLSRTRDERTQRPVWECQCDCGNKKLVTSSDLTHGRVMSCGCFHSEMVAKRNFRHGLKRHPLYMVWRDIKDRCYNSKNIGYHRYGGRGILMCDEWLNSPDVFIRWGETHGYEKGLQIDRIDNDKGYSPDNCRFVTCHDNNRNKSTNYFVEYNGEKKVLKDWAEEIGFSSCGLKQRIETVGVEKAFTKPKRPLRRRFIECRGECKTITEWANEVGMNPMTLHWRLKHHTPEVAIFTPVGCLNSKQMEAQGAN